MECSSEEREMEVEALQSIYGEHFTVMAAKGGDDAPVYEMKLQPTTTKIIFTIPGKNLCFFSSLLHLSANTVVFRITVRIDN